MTRAATPLLKALQPQLHRQRRRPRHLQRQSRCHRLRRLHRQRRAQGERRSGGHDQAHAAGIARGHHYAAKSATFCRKAPSPDFKKRVDYSEYGGAPLLGVKGVCIICHGRSNANAIKNAIRVAKEFAERQDQPADRGRVQADATWQSSDRSLISSSQELDERQAPVGLDEALLCAA